MNVIFYTLSKRINSTSQPSGGTTFDVILKEGCSVQRPSVRLKYAGVANPTGYNYAYIADFGRYYWVEDWSFEDRQWTSFLRVDVLASYKTEIGNSSQYVARSAFAYNGGIVDTMYPTHCMPSCGHQDAAIWSPPDISTIAGLRDQTFIVSTMSSSGFQLFYLMSGEQYASFAGQVFASALWNGYDFGDITLDTVRAMSSPEDKVCSVQWLPLSWSTVTATPVGSVEQFVYLGDHVLPIVDVRLISPQDVHSFSVTYTLNRNPQASTRGAYLDGNTYTERTLFIPAVGNIALDSDLCIDCDNLQVSVRVNLASGSASFVVRAYRQEQGQDVKSNILAIHSSKISIDFGYGTTRFDASGVISNVLSAVGSGVNGDPIGTANGIMSSIRSAFPRTTVLNTSGSIGDFLLPMRLRETHYMLLPEDRADKGRPLCDVRQLSTLPGYIQCEGATLQLPCTGSELQEVLGFLEGGFFYE